MCGGCIATFWRLRSKKTRRSGKGCQPAAAPAPPNHVAKDSAQNRKRTRRNKPNNLARPQGPTRSHPCVHLIAIGVNSERDPVPLVVQQGFLKDARRAHTQRRRRTLGTWLGVDGTATSLRTTPPCPTLQARSASPTGLPSSLTSWLARAAARRDSAVRSSVLHARSLVTAASSFRVTCSRAWVASSRAASAPAAAAWCSARRWAWAARDRSSSAASSADWSRSESSACQVRNKSRATSDA